MTDSTNAKLEDADPDQENQQRVVVVPTSHVSTSSSDLVEETIRTVEPDIVALELDKKRLDKLQTQIQAKQSNNPQQNLSLTEVLTQSNLPFRARLVFAGMYKLQSSIQNKLPIDITGQDMSSGVTTAAELGLPIATVDRDLTETLTRLSTNIPTLQLLKMLAFGMVGYIQLQRKSEEELQKEVDVDNLDETEITSVLESQLPQFKSVFIDERDHIIAQNTANLLNNDQYSTIVLVIGSAHKIGVIPQLQNLLPEAQIQTAPLTERF